MKVGSVITRVRSIAGDTNVMQFTDSDIIDWLNDGIRDCVISNNLLQKDASSSTAVGVAEYQLPSDIIKLHSVTVDGSKLGGLTFEEWQQRHGAPEASSETGRPVLFYIWAGKLVLYPSPDQVFSLKISYINSPVELSYAGTNGVADSTTKNQNLPLPVEYQPRLVDYCLAQVAQQDGDNNTYALKMQEYATGVSQLKDKPEYQDDMYPFINVSNRDSGWDVLDGTY